MADADYDEVAGADEAPAQAATVTVKGPGISITRPVDDGTMANVIALLFGAAPQPRGGGSGGGQGARVTQQQPTQEWDADLTLGEFISESGATTFQQKICAAGFYLTNFQEKESFSREDVRTALSNAREDMPGNYARDFNGAVSSHLIAGKEGVPGQFIIPRTGRTAVNSKFQDVPKRRNNRRTSKKGSAKGDAE